MIFRASSLIPLAAAALFPPGRGGLNKENNGPWGAPISRAWTVCATIVDGGFAGGVLPAWTIYATSVDGLCQQHG